MKYYLLTFIPLIFTVPIFGKQLLFGIPMWAIVSLMLAVIYAISLVIIIDKKWDEIS